MRHTMMKKRAESFFGLHFDLHPKFNDTNLGAEVSEANILKLLKRVRPDYVSYDCKGHEGYAGYHTEVGISAPNIQNDSLKLWRKVTKTLDISLAIHYSGLQDFEQVRKNAQYGVQDMDGRTDGRTASLFSGYAKDIMIPQLLEAVKKYDLDGVWLDAECWGTQYDYSPNAILEWQKYSKQSEIPTSGHVLWGKFQDFYRNKLEDYICNWIDSMHKEYKDLDCCSNWAYTTMMPKEKKADIAIISGDFDPFLSVDRARTECRYLENTEFPWELQSWGFDLVDGQGPCQKSVSQIQQEAAVVLMHGGGYMNYFLPTRGGYINDSIINTLGEIADFCYERKEDSYRLKPVHDIAVLYPTVSQLNRSDKIYTWWGHRLDEVEGVLHSLLENQVSATVMSEAQFVKNMADLNCVFIPECDYLDSDIFENICQFARNGGKVVLCGGKVSKLFEKQLGITINGIDTATTTIESSGEKLALSGDWASVEATSRAILFRYEGNSVVANSFNMDVRDSELSTVTAGIMKKKPAIVLNQFGKGVFVGVLCDLGRQYFKNHHFYLRHIVHDLLNRIYQDRKVLVNSPYTVDISLRQNNKKELVLHLLNTTNMPVGDTRKFTNYVPNVENICVKIKSNYMPTKVCHMPEGKEIEFKYDGKIVEFTIDKMHIHSIVKLVK